MDSWPKSLRPYDWYEGRLIIRGKPNPATSCCVRWRCLTLHYRTKNIILEWRKADFFVIHKILLLWEKNGASWGSHLQPTVGYSKHICGSRSNWRYFEGNPPKHMANWVMYNPRVILPFCSKGFFLFGWWRRITLCDHWQFTTILIYLTRYFIITVNKIIYIYSK